MMKKNVFMNNLANKIKLFGFTAAATLLFAPNVLADTSCNIAAGEIASVTTGENTVCYTTLTNALKAATTGSVVRVEDSYTVSGSYELRNVTAYADFILDLNGKTISGGGSAVLIHNDISDMTIIDSVGGGAIVNTGTGNAVLLQGKEEGGVTIKGGTFTAGKDSIAIRSIKNGKHVIIDAKNQGDVVINGSTGIYVSKGGSIEFTNGTINSEGYGIALFDNSSLHFYNGEIYSNGFALTGTHGQSNGATMVIDNGYIEGKVAAIYQPYNGTTTINGGELTGGIGILARQGQVIINNGTVTATGTPGEEVWLGTKDSIAPNGVAIIIDNKTESYTDAKASLITNAGTFISTYDEAVVSLDADLDIVVNGGTYYPTVNKDFIKNEAVKSKETQDGILVGLEHEVHIQVLGSGIARLDAIAGEKISLLEFESKYKTINYERSSVTDADGNVIAFSEGCFIMPDSDVFVVLFFDYGEPAAPPKESEDEPEENPDKEPEDKPSTSEDSDKEDEENKLPDTGVIQYTGLAIICLSAGLIVVKRLRDNM